MAGSSLPLLGVALSAFVALTVSVQVVLVRVGAEHGSVRQAVLLSLGVNFLVFLPAAAVIHFPDYGLTLRSLLSFVAAGFMGTFLGRLLYYDSIDRIGAGRTEPLKSSMPLFASLIAVLLLGETLTTAHTGGILLIVVGIAAISWETTNSGAERGEDVSVTALGLPLLAAMAFATEPNLVRIGFAEGTPILVGLTLKTAAAGLGFLGYLRYRGTLRFDRLLGEPHSKWYLAAAVANTLSVLGYYAALKVSRVVVVAPITQTSPLIVAVLAYAFLSHLEHISWRLITASCLVVVGAAVVTVFG
ncbi:DMT family transporter [Halorarius litoreus]|uniref:DMT family transporter n=1 Tax=Halorarius litoreus TaxID=2962676 RepID=UPI0020CDCCC7|nr:DMT family transporter [Halorarius litoreus]